MLVALKYDVIFGQQKKTVVVGAALVNISKFSYSCVKMVLLFNVTFFFKAKEFVVCVKAPRTSCWKPILLCFCILSEPSCEKKK